jgi:hypothetical protein
MFADFFGCVFFLIIVGHLSARSRNLSEGAPAGGSIHRRCERIANRFCKCSVDHSLVQSLTRFAVVGFVASAVRGPIAPKVVLDDTTRCDRRTTIKTIPKFSLGYHL